MRGRCTRRSGTGFFLTLCGYLQPLFNTNLRLR